MDTAAGLPVATQLVLYDNDAVEISYSDGGCLQLSPCGAVFAYQAAQQSGQHPLAVERMIQQRCEFVTSTYRPLVEEAVLFRNMFAEKPYLCRNVLDPSRVLSVQSEIVETAWPDPCPVTLSQDGSLAVVSAGDHVRLTLAPCRQVVTVSLLCKTSQHRKKGNTSKSTADRQMSTPSNKAPRDIVSLMSAVSIAEPNSGQPSDSTSPDMLEARWFYVRVAQHYSVDTCPSLWAHPLSYLMQAAKKNSNSVHFDSDEPKSKNRSGPPAQSLKSVYTVLPDSLPANCGSPHLHKWKRQTSESNHGNGDVLAGVAQGRLKVVCTQGVIYRFVRTPAVAIEILPGDGSMLKSSGLSGHYFKHWFHKAGKVEEKVYSVIHPPPDDPEKTLSISKLISRGARFLQHLCEENLHYMNALGTDKTCWKLLELCDTLREPRPCALLEECTVEGIGRFTAHSSGRIKVVFADRTSLEMTADLSKRIRHASDDDVADKESGTSVGAASQAVTYPRDLPEGTCRLLLPNGHYQCVRTTDPAQYHRYVSAALEWVSWVNSTPSERYSFYKDSIHDWDAWLAVDKEVKKISCFNYIMEHTMLPQSCPLVSTPDTAGDTPTAQPNATLTDAHRMFPSNSGSRPISDPHLTDNVDNDLNCYSPAGLNEAMAKTMKSLRGQTSTGQWSQNADRAETGVSFQSVQDVLRQTSMAIKDLDLFLDRKAEGGFEGDLVR